MATVEEQLTELRIAHIKRLYNGQPEAVIKAAIKNIHRMEFDSVEEFETYAVDAFQNDPTREASEEELNVICANMGLDVTKDTRTTEEKEIDEIFKYI